MSSNVAFHLTGGAFYAGAHAWRNKLNSWEDFPTFGQLNKEFDDSRLFK